MEQQPQFPAGPAPGIWHDWPAFRILGLAVLLMAGDFTLQIVLYTVGGGLFLPVLAGTLGGVLLPLAIVVRRGNLPFRPDFSWWRPTPLVVCAAALMAVGALAPTSLLAQLSLRLHPADPQWATFMNDNMPRGALGIGVAFLTVGLAAPLAEELIFRGLLHRLASRLWGRWPAVIVSSLVFALVHGEPWYLFGLIGIGVVLAVVYEATGSVLACWITHVVHNSISLVLMIRGGESSTEPLPVTAGDAMIAAGSLALLVLLSVLLLRAPRSDGQAQA
jgi:membrane protease YdiL (CAAX protease family)